MPIAGNIVVQVRCRNSLVRAGIEATLRQMPDVHFYIEEERSEGQAPGAANDDLQFDVLVADYQSGVEAAMANKVARGGKRPANVLVVTARESEAEIRHALHSGVCGYLLVGCRVDEFIGGVRAVARGMRPLSSLAAQRVAESLVHPLITARESDVLNLLARGFPNKAIASRLGITVGTVKTHVRNLFEKLPASSRTEAAAVAERRGLLAEADGDHDSVALEVAVVPEPLWSSGGRTFGNVLREAA